MKYWIFQNNQVLGPYDPDEMGKISVFSPESLVCPEGRRGTSMGDWQRAGMVPDLSVALVRAGSAEGKGSVLSIAGLPPEPTLKDLAELGSVQEKVAMLEQVVIQLQEGLRAKDAELTTVHQDLAGKSREANEIRAEAASRQREAEELKRQLAGLEERLTSVRQLSETLDKAVEEEKRVEQDVEKQGQSLSELTREVETLRRQLDQAKPQPADISAFTPPPMSFEPMPSPPAREIPAESPKPIQDFPTISAPPVPAFDASMPAMPGPAAQKSSAPSFDPLAFDTPGGTLAPQAAPAAAVESDDFGVIAPPPEPKGKKALLIGAVLGVAALGGLAVMGGFVPGLRKPKAPDSVLEPAPLPPPEPTPQAPAAPDSRELAVEFAKAWQLPGNRTLERALEELAPSTGNLSPWMADPLAGSRIQVNYFARSSAPGAPTIAYEFEVDLEGRTLVGRNAAAKSVLTGKAAAPPAPPKPKPVRVKPKPAAKKAPVDESLDTMLGDAPVTAPPAPEDGGTTLTDTGDSPSAEEQAPPARANPARRASKAKAGKGEAKPAPADEALLDDLLKE